ncbi:hypothetical protein TSOC_007780 [Tetrabaena socialis]|uniref:Methyltransferase domain-containing protein n=1 Tax=Tetrabaena socialis TaxID=47790 RepID=A0A2J8A073_9CHLO|nr:hypothetical protein TSOC_007780 [Tetrabaena socialis]|eukprot:PNH05919.1 hypothetical protein TSOC_007780 [Tetrabaena socialis]
MFMRKVKAAHECSIGEAPSCHDEYEPGANVELDEMPELTVEAIHRYMGSSRDLAPDDKGKIRTHVTGTGLAPWEIHRPQKVVRDLVLRRCFEGRVLDAGCGIGDNALYLAKACPAAEVTAVDLVARCLEFAAAKADLRGMKGKVHLLLADLLEQDLGKLPGQLGAEVSGSFSVVLDSSTFHCLSDAERERYVPTLHRLLRPGGRIYMNCMSEEETRPGGPRRIPVADLQSVFNAASGWEVESVEATIIEVHPASWGGEAKARLFTIRKL